MSNPDDALACELHGTNLQHFKGMHPDPAIVMLDLRNNRLEHFYGFPTFENLQCLRVDGNSIESFLGMSYQPRLQVLTIAGNPIADHPDYRILALLACGDSLREVDGSVITDEERALAEQCGGSSGPLAQMVSLGWTSLDYGDGGGLSPANEEWCMEKCKAHFLRVSQEVDERRSFGRIAPDSADLVPLAAEVPRPLNFQRQQNQRSPPRRGFPRHVVAAAGKSAAEQHAAYHNYIREHEFAAAAALGVAEFHDAEEQAAAAASCEGNDNSGNGNPDDHHSHHSSSHTLTARDANLLLRDPQQPNFGRNRRSASAAGADDQETAAERSEASRFGATQMLMQNRAHQIFARVHMPAEQREKANAVELAREYARAFRETTGGAEAPRVVSNNGNNNTHTSTTPSPTTATATNAAAANNTATADTASTTTAAGPSPPSQNMSPSVRVSGAQMTLSRADVVCFDSVDMSSFDVSAQWQPPKSGTIQIVRATLRVMFNFHSDSLNNNAVGAALSASRRTRNSSNSKSNASLVVLDDAARIVATFLLPVSSPSRPQSLWIHEGNPPAIALCSEQEGGVIDVVIMPSAGAVEATSRSQALHKLLIHAMAEHVVVADEHNDNNHSNTNNHQQPSPSTSPQPARPNQIEEL